MAGFSIFGGAGFVGRHLARHLVRSGHDVQSYDRGNWPCPGQHLGHVMFAIGMTANFRVKPLETAEAHVSVLTTVLRNYSFASLLYFSSTRVYLGSDNGMETGDLVVNPNNPSYLYNVTKLAGEALCMTLPSMGRAVRLSNVIGPDAPSETFLPSVIHDAQTSGYVEFNSAATSIKDYVDIDSVCSMLECIALHGRDRLYNVASGIGTSNAVVADLIRKRLGAPVHFAPNAPALCFPPIDISRISTEFAFKPIAFDASFEKLLKSQSETNQ
jgi:nucleoside-diphosphate-sugar epimerase